MKKSFVLFNLLIPLQLKGRTFHERQGKEGKSEKKYAPRGL